MRKIGASILEHLGRGWVVLASGLLFLAFLLVFLPAQAEQSATYAEGVGSPDTALWITPAELYDIVEAYGPSGRQRYLRSRWTFDVAFPLAYSVFFFSSISFCWRRLWPGRGSSRRWPWLAAAAGFTDLLENSLMSIIVVRYPQELTAVAYLAVAASALKWVMVSASMVLALGGLFLLGTRRLLALLR